MMDDQTNLQAAFAAITDDELDQVTGGFKRGQNISYINALNHCVRQKCGEMETVLRTKIVCINCPYAD